MSPKTCLFIGRFQPFHKGHLMVLKGMTKVCGHVVIGIGSSESKISPENPFTFDERRDMIQRALQEEDLIPTFNIDLMPLPDHASDETWTKQCLEKVGEVSLVWTGDKATKACFEKAGVAVQDIREVPGISATEIRRRMMEGGNWKEQVPDAVVDFLIEIDGVERVRKLGK